MMAAGGLRLAAILSRLLGFWQLGSLRLCMGGSAGEGAVTEFP